MVAAMSSSPTPPVPIIIRDDGIMDTRTDAGVSVAASPVIATPDNEKEKDEAEAYQPDLGAEVAVLSTKLVNAINLQTTLDDTLQHTRHDLDQTRQKCDALEAENKRLTDMISDGELMKRREVDEIVGNLRMELQKEKTAREAAERARKQTEGELENLTTALFEEANTMVAAARKEVEMVERKNGQLKGQLKDTEVLMMSQQMQLRDLKDTLEKVQGDEKGRMARGMEGGSVPGTPIVASSSNAGAGAYEDSATSTPRTGTRNSHDTASSMDQNPPNHPLHFSHLIAPMLKHDTNACTEFRDLLTLTRRLGAHSRTNSSSQSGGVHSSSASTANLANSTTSSSSPSMPGGFSFSTTSSPSSSSFSNNNNNIPALKDSRYYKRVLTEDLEPTLRLDIAPGLSFLSRRTVLSSLLSGSLSIEPFPPNKHYYACALCGESRRTDEHVRKYHFRTSEDDTAPKPLCDMCLGRVRSTCDFVGFLRMARDGVLKGDSEEEMKLAWEENVKLRERMWWARVGGGVVPVQVMQQQQQQGVGNGSSSGSLGKVDGAAETTSSLDAVVVNSVPAERKKTAVERPKSFVTPPGSGKLGPADAPAGVEEDREPDSAVSDASGSFEDARQEVQGDVEADADADARTPTEKDAAVQKRPRAVSLLPDLPVVVPAEKGGESEKKNVSREEIREVGDADADGDDEEEAEVPRVSVEVAEDEEVASEVGGDAADEASREGEEKHAAQRTETQAESAASQDSDDDEEEEDTAAEASRPSASRAPSQRNSTLNPTASASESASASEDTPAAATATAPAQPISGSDSTSSSTSKHTSLPASSSSSSSSPSSSGAATSAAKSAETAQKETAATSSAQSTSPPKRLSAIPRSTPSSTRNSTATSLAPSPASSRPGSRTSIRSTSTSSVMARVKAMEGQGHA